MFKVFFFSCERGLLIEWYTDRLRADVPLNVYNGDVFISIKFWDLILCTLEYGYCVFCTQQKMHNYYY